MKEREIIERLQRAITDTPVDLLETLQNTKVQKMTAHDRYTRQKWADDAPARTDFFTFFKPMMAAAILLIMIGFGWVWSQMPVATLYLDINPAVSLTMNRLHTVTGAEGYNEDGKALLAELEIVGAKRDEALRLLNSSVPERGVSLVSVETASRRLLRETEEAVRTLLEGSDIVLSQPVPASEAAGTDAAALGISPGKLELIRKILAAGSVREAAYLAELPMDQLITALYEENIDIRTLVRVDGDTNRLRPDPEPPVEIIWPEPETEPPATEPPVLPDDDDDWDDDDWDDDDWDDDDWDDDDWDDDDWDDDDWDDDDWDDDDWDDDDWDDDDEEDDD